MVSSASARAPKLAKALGNSVMDFIAHTENSKGDWHKLAEHLSAVGQLAAEFGAQMNPELVESGRWAGLLHDLAPELVRPVHPFLD